MTNSKKLSLIAIRPVTAGHKNMTDEDLEALVPWNERVQELCK